jgi:hypothetical protein
MTTTATQDYARLDETKTATRVYFVIRSWGKYHAHYQPLNPKTGERWQASRRLSPWEGLATEAEAVAAIAAQKEKSGK